MNRLAHGLLLAGFMFGAAPVRAVPAAYPSKPKAVVERYLQLDADAAGLAAETWPELGQYTNFPQAPAWESFVVIERYEIGKVLEAHTRAQVRVTYYPLGKLSDKFVPDIQPENIVFFLNKIKEQWKVDSPPLVPHVSYAVMQKRLNANSAANPKEKKTNDALLQQIEAVRQKVK
jgi:hypothetical protein